MGAKQSQDSTTSDLPPVPATTAREERSVLLPYLQEAVYPPNEESTNQRARDLEMPIQPFFADQAPEGNSFAGFSDSSGLDHRDRPRHNQDRQNQDRHHHHHNHRSRQHHRDRTHSERGGGHGHSRRAHRYLMGDVDSEPVGMEFDFSLAALNQRLRALQLRQESEENGSGSSGGSSSRHHNRSHSSRSHPRNPFSSSLPGGSLFFMRPPERSKWGGTGLPLSWTDGAHRPRCPR